MPKKQMGGTASKKKVVASKATKPATKTKKTVAKKPAAKPVAKKPAKRQPAKSKSTILEIADSAMDAIVPVEVTTTLKKSEHWHTLLFALVVIVAAYLSYQASNGMVPTKPEPVDQTPVVQQPVVSSEPKEEQFVFPTDYAWTTQKIGGDLVLAGGERGELTITVKNTGKATWYRDSKNAFRLGTLQPTDEIMPFMASSMIGENQLREAVGRNRIEMEQKTVAPGETATFRLQVTASDWDGKLLPKGKYPITVGFLVEGKGTLSKNPLTWNVVVK